MSSVPQSGAVPNAYTTFRMAEVDGENVGIFSTDQADRPVIMSETMTIAFLRLGIPPRFSWRDRGGVSILYAEGEAGR